MPKLAIITGFLGAIKNRYINYQEDRPLADKLSLAASVNEITGLELCYPQDFGDLGLLKELLRQHRLGVSAINFRSRRTGQWMRGSFSSHLAEERHDVVADLKKAMDAAVETGCNRITTCPLNEGHDYVFEMDYFQAYDSFEQTIREAAGHNPDVRICIEYKWNDPRARCLIGNAGEALAFCQQVNLPNVGVTLDIGHAIQAGERAAQSAVMLARANRLFYVHLNDNDKIWDWDMLPGAYNFWDFIEFFYYLRKIGYQDWFAYDVFPKEIDTLDTFNAVTAITLKLMEISERVEPDQMEALLKKRNPVEAMLYLYSKI
jgi:xylose isomerase